MLVLTRKTSQSIRVGEITITVVRVGQKNVRIGIDAPGDVEIVRSEIDGRAPAPRESLEEAAA